MHQSPLVTVVVPIYNVEKYLDRCIESIVNQTYRNLEIILVDDGSPDRCPRMCDEWARRDDRIRVIHKSNAGLGMARNTGLENATGEYICFFDSDDFIELSAIEKSLGLMQKNSADIVLFGMSRVDRYGKIIEEIIPQTQKQWYFGEEIEDSFLPDLIDCNHRAASNRKLCLSVCSCLFSMALIKRADWKFVSEREIISEDSFSLLYLYDKVEKIGVLSETMYYYCENNTSLTRTYREDRFDEIKHFYFEIMDLAEALHYNEEVKKSISGLFISFVIAAMKQIASAKTSLKKRLELLFAIIADETTQKAIYHIACRKYGLAREVLFLSIRKRRTKLIYILLLLWQFVKKNK